MAQNPVEIAIQNALAVASRRETIANIFFVACGGSFAQMHLAQYAVDRESATIGAESLTSAEFIARDPKRLNTGAVAILCSSSGNTPETIAAAKFAREHGALTIVLTTKPESELAKAGEVVVPYVSIPVFGTQDTPAGIILRIALGIVDAREGCAKYPLLLKALAKVEAVTAKLQAAHAAAAAAWGEANKRQATIYTLSSGANWGVGYSYAICILQEMQWINSQGIHSGEYFHGPFEITDFDTPFILLCGLGSTRKMDERARAFVTKYSKNVLILDAAEFDLEGMDPTVAEYATPLIFQPLLRTYAEKLGESRGHPLTVRRYMWKMSY